MIDRGEGAPWGPDAGSNGPFHMHIMSQVLNLIS